MQLGFFFGVPAYFRVCFRILGREDVDLVDLAMALDWRPKTKKLLSLFEHFHPQGTNWVSGCIQNGVSGCIQNEVSGCIQNDVSGCLQNVSVSGFQLG